MSEDLGPLIEILAGYGHVAVDTPQIEGHVRRLLEDWADLMHWLDPDDEP